MGGDETTEILQDHGAHSNCFWLIDANAEPGPADGHYCVLQGHEREPPPTQSSSRTACTNSLCVCRQLHTSIMEIETPGRDQMERRPSALTTLSCHKNWREFCTRSEVLYDFDLATTRCDHQAVGLELSWWQTCETTSQGKRMPKVAWHDDEPPGKLSRMP